jgi:hypothetical protein
VTPGYGGGGAACAKTSTEGSAVEMQACVQESRAQDGPDLMSPFHWLRHAIAIEPDPSPDHGLTSWSGDPAPSEPQGTGAPLFEGTG